MQLHKNLHEAEDKGGVSDMLEVKSIATPQGHDKNIFNSEAEFSPWIFTQNAQQCLQKPYVIYGFEHKTHMDQCISTN